MTEDKAQKERLSAANTDTLHASGPDSPPASVILANAPFFTWTHCAVSVC